MNTISRAEVENLLKMRATLVEAFLDSYLEHFPCAPQRLKAAMLYSLRAGGKRLRPALCLGVAALCGLGEQALMPFAAAIEMIHTYSLIHDDLPAMDNDDLRRGKPSNHKRFDEATAILAGDGLLTDAFYVALLTKLPSERLLPALRELALAAGSNGMVGGQMLDMEYTGKAQVTLAGVAQMQQLKTGAMIKAACVCGALLAGAAKETVAAIATYGACLGKAFQIADDILDLTATTEELGKPAGSDQASGKNTYPSLLGIEESRKLSHLEVEKAKAALPAAPEAAFLAGLADYVVARSG